jgi:hypothetical protein
MKTARNIGRLFDRAREIHRVGGGFSVLLAESARKVRYATTTRLGAAYCTVRRGTRHFSLGGQEYPYCLAAYNYAWTNERTVEVPIAARVSEEHKGKRVLEVGNVLPYYLSSTSTRRPIGF